MDRICSTAKSVYIQAKNEQDIDNPKALFSITDSLMNKPKHDDPKVLENDYVFFFPKDLDHNTLGEVMKTAMEEMASATEAEIRQIIFFHHARRNPSLIWTSLRASVHLVNFHLYQRL